MSYPPGRGRINKRYLDNTLKQTLPRQGYSHFTGAREEFNTQPVPRRIPHYEEDPFWKNRQDNLVHGRDHHTDTSYHDYKGIHHEPERIPTANPRGAWNHGRRTKQSGRGARGRVVAKAEPPLVLGGIPHLKRSFVMNKNSDDPDACSEKETLDKGETGSACTSSMMTPNVAGENSRNKSSVGSMERDAGCKTENNYNAKVSEAWPQHSSTDNTQIADYRQEVPKRHSHACEESVNIRGLLNESRQVHQELNVENSAANESQKVTNYNSERNHNYGKAYEDNSSVCQPSIAPSQTSVPADTAKLEMETERYYDELLGKEESEKNVAEKLSASQVAKITISYKTDEEQKKAEEERIKEVEQREKEQQAQIESAWSVLHQYWQFVRENPYDFNGWTYLLNHVESMDNLEVARSAFDGFLPLYPYCFAYWKKLSDMELKHNDMRRCLGVLLIGTECVPFCTDLWVSLLNNMIMYAKQMDFPLQLVRELYESGLNCMGQSWHSSSLWDACINYEQNNGNLVTVMALYRRLIQTPTRLFNKHWDHFLALVRDHHPRSLLPVEEYQALRKQACEELKIRYTPTSHMPPKTIQKTPQPEDKLTSCIKEKLVALYIKTHECNEEEVDKRWKFEEKIKRPYFHVKPLDKRQIKNWNEYLDFEIGEGEPLKIIPLFERSLVACALYEDFWCRYALYMEKHTQNVLDEKERDLASDKDTGNDGYEKECEDKKNTEITVPESVENDEENNNAGKHHEANKEEDSLDGENIEKQVNDKSIDVKNVKDDTVVRGSDVKVDKNIVRDLRVESHDNNDSTIGSDLVKMNLREQLQTSEVGDGQNKVATEIIQVENERQIAKKTEPPTLEQLKSELCSDLNISERVLKCPPLTPQWIKSGVSWEDVRRIYRRGAWIHCPSKPGILMQWAEFEETQGNLDTSRELLNTVITKYPTLLKARMYLIELERRAGCYQRVEELYAEASRTFTQPRQRSWLAIKYARFLFKILLEADRALAVLRKALKKDRGNVHLYHHVFDICYQRQPLDCQGVLASVLLALASKELSVSDKHWFAHKRVEFLREHGDIKELKKAQQELAELKELADKINLTVKQENVKQQESEELNTETMKSTENKTENKDSKCGEDKETVVASTAESSEPKDDTTDALPIPVNFSDPQLNQQFPVPYFAADGAITYNPMAGYGYGHSDPNQALPTAQEIVQGGTQDTQQQKPREEYHKVPPTWEFEIQTGSYGYGKSEEHRWHQEDGYHQYNDLLASGYPQHLKDKEIEEVKIPFPINIEHLRRRAGDQDPAHLPDMSQPPPSAAGGLPPISATTPTTMTSCLPPHKFTRPPPSLGLGPPGLFPPGFGPPPNQMDALPPGDSRLYSVDSQHRRFDSPTHFGKRRHLDDYSVKGEPPYKMHCMDNFDLGQQYRPEYDTNYTASPGPSAPPTHRADYGSYSTNIQSYSQYTQKDDEHLRKNHDERHDLPLCRDSPELSRFNESNRYSLRDANSFDLPLPKELDAKEAERLCANVPDWLIQDGGELCLSDTERGISLIRYWPNFMTQKGEKTIFRILRKGLKWHQRRAITDGQWQNLPHLLSWIGPCDYSYSGVVLEKNTNWLPEIVDLLHRLIRYTGNQYNSCILNLHRNGYDHVAWMEERHPALRDNPSIASVSLGSSRLFEMRRKDGRGFLRFPLFPGSLLLMEGATQEDWQHQFPKEPNVPGERIHMTFRKLYMIEGLTV
ncbi:hypothetical protein OTU49_016278 [Cherax quadricarinatus]|uniref:Alpha-ketoglutarate-dependent dioxygenase AlkB-like domain-containing protein n=2 Tax=Cherax quadricarinatus TaxID=27406 RepID=A0AAW0Y7R1_CHEQU